MGILTRRLWTVCLLAPALACGCNRTVRPPTPYPDCATYVRVRPLPDCGATQAAPVPTAAPAILVPPQTGVPDMPTRLPDYVPAPVPAAQKEALKGQVQQPAKAASPVVRLPEEIEEAPPSAPPATVIEVPSPQIGMQPCGPPAVLPPVEIEVPRPPSIASAQNKENGPARPTLGGDLTIRSSVLGAEPACPASSAVVPVASTHFGHAADYAWLKGEVQKSLRGIRLRYARVDEEDVYGGSVTLVADAQVEGLQDGQVVQVRGHLVHADGQSSAPPYKVLSVEPAAR